MSELEGLFSQICHESYPDEWDENDISFQLMRELRNLFSKIIGKLKGQGSRWCISEQAWQRHISPSAIYWGIDIARQYT